MHSLHQFVSERKKIRLSTYAITITIITVLLIMFLLGYTESLRWPPGIPKATHGFLKGLLFVLTALLIVFRKRFYPSKDPLGVLFILTYALSFVISAVFTDALDAAVLFLWYPFICLAMFYAFTRLRPGKKFFLLFLQLAVILIFVTASFSFFSLMFRYSIDNIYYLIFQDHRANQLLGELRSVGKYVSIGPYIMLTPIGLYFLILSGASKWRQILSLFVFTLSVLTAVMSNNRVDAVILAIQFAVFLFLLPRRTAVIMLLLAIPVVQFGLNTSKTYFGYNIRERLFNPQVQRDQETINIRFTYWQTALYNFKNSPIVGIGPNAYNDLSEFPIRRYFGEGPHAGYTMRLDEGIGVHNLFIERLSDTGLIGFTAFVVMLSYFFRKDLIYLLSQNSTELRKRYILFALGSWTWILYGITDNGYGAQGMVTFFVIRGVMNHII